MRSPLLIATSQTYLLVPGVTEGLGSQAPGSMEGGKKSKLAGLKVGMVTRKRRQRRASGGFLLLSGVCN